MKLFSVFGCYSKVLRFLFVCHLLFSSMQVVLLDDGTTLVSRLILDVMGNSSPIVRQVGLQ